MTEPLPTLNGNMAANLLEVVKWTDARLEKLEERQGERMEALTRLFSDHKTDCDAAMAPYRKLSGSVSLIADHPRLIGAAAGLVVALLIFVGILDADSVARFWP